MNPRLSYRLLSAALLSGLMPVARAETCCETSPAATPLAASIASSADQPASSPAPAGHPLRGVVVDILADQQALLVQHEEIPGVMRAMTMLLKVDAGTLAAAKKDQTITARLVKKNDGWWLEEAKSVPARQGS